MTFINSYQHHGDCEFWFDQYPFECTCGLTAERPEWSTLVQRAPSTITKLPAASENSQ
jgi:hypothetical protein